MSAIMGTGGDGNVARLRIAIGMAASLLLAGCAGLAPSGTGRPATPGGTVAAPAPDFSGPEVTVDLALDQAALDPAIRKAKAFEALVARAEGGDDEAQFEVAEDYAHGHDVEKDPDEAKKWYLRAAQSGNERSREYLVKYYIDNTLIGYEPKTDFVKVLPWLKDAAKAGNVVAQEILARKYAKGEEVPRDYYEARRWLQALADRGLVNAEYSLAVMYHQGLGVEPDPRTAYKWFEAAAKQGDGRAEYMVALMNYYGRGVDQNLSAAHEWAEKAAKQEDSEVKRHAITLLEALDSMEASRPKPPPIPAECLDLQAAAGSAGAKRIAAMDAKAAAALKSRCADAMHAQPSAAAPAAAPEKADTGASAAEKSNPGASAPSATAPAAKH